MTDEPQVGGGDEKPNEKKRIRHAHIRDKIRASVILDRLEKNALGELSPAMDAQQIKSAEICLKKVIPDLSAITIGNEEDQALRVINTIELRAVKPRNNESGN